MSKRETSEFDLDELIAFGRTLGLDLATKPTFHTRDPALFELLGARAHDTVDRPIRSGALPYIKSTPGRRVIRTLDLLADLQQHFHRNEPSTPSRRPRSPPRSRTAAGDPRGSQRRG